MSVNKEIAIVGAASLAFMAVAGTGCEAPDRVIEIPGGGGGENPTPTPDNPIDEVIELSLADRTVKNNEVPAVRNDDGYNTVRVKVVELYLSELEPNRKYIVTDVPWDVKYVYLRGTSDTPIDLEIRRCGVIVGATSNGGIVVANAPDLNGNFSHEYYTTIPACDVKTSDHGMMFYGYGIKDEDNRQNELPVTRPDERSAVNAPHSSEEELQVTGVAKEFVEDITPETQDYLKKAEKSGLRL